MGGVPYFDLHALSEDERIDVIGKSAMGGKRVAFMVDNDGEKADRYVGKLRERFAGIAICDQKVGPTPNVVTIVVGPPRNKMQ